MRKVTKIVAVVMVVILLSGQVVYASPFTDFFTKRSSFCNFWQKSVYKDRIYNLGYKKVILPVGRRVENSVGAQFLTKTLPKWGSIVNPLRRVGVLAGICLGLGVPPARDTVAALKNNDSEYLKLDRSYHQEPIIDFFKTLPKRVYNHILDLKKAEDKGGIVGFVRGVIGKLSYGEKWMVNDVARYQTHLVPGTNSWTEQDWSGIINPNSREVANAEKNAKIDVINSGQSNQYNLDEVGLPHTAYVSDDARYAKDLWQKPNLTLKTDQGDCDDNAIAFAAILERENRPYRVIAGWNDDGSSGHLWVETKDVQGNRWVLDFDGATRSSATGQHQWGPIPRTMFSRNVAPTQYNPNW